MMTPIPAPASNTASGLARPRRPATGAGRPKMPLPTMQLTASATMLQRPMARTNSACELSVGTCTIAPLYHIERADAPTHARGLPRSRASALHLRDTPRVQRHRRALRHRQAPAIVGGEEAAARPLRSRLARSRGQARGHRGADAGALALARALAGARLRERRQPRRDRDPAHSPHPQYPAGGLPAAAREGRGAAADRLV